jgi:hypothetical protein
MENEKEQNPPIDPTPEQIESVLEDLEHPETEPEPPTEEVDLALAALSTLESLPLVQEPFAVDEAYLDEPISDNLEENSEPTTAPEVVAVAAVAAAITFIEPPISQLERGQFASIVPAFLLIGAGVGLTFLLTTGGTLPTANVLAGGALVGVGISLWAAWLSNGRWASGNFLLGLIALVCGVALMVL